MGNKSHACIWAIISLIAQNGSSLSNHAEVQASDVSAAGENEFRTVIRATKDVQTGSGQEVPAARFKKRPISAASAEEDITNSQPTNDPTADRDTPIRDATDDSTINTAGQFWREKPARGSKEGSSLQRRFKRNFEGIKLGNDKKVKTRVIKRTGKTIGASMHTLVACITAMMLVFHIIVCLSIYQQCKQRQGRIIAHNPAQTTTTPISRPRRPRNGDQSFSVLAEEPPLIGQVQEPPIYKEHPSQPPSYENIGPNSSKTNPAPTAV